MTSRHEQRTGTDRVRPLTALSASRHQSPSSHLSLNLGHVLTRAGSHIHAQVSGATKGWWLRVFMVTSTISGRQLSRLLP